MLINGQLNLPFLWKAPATKKIVEVFLSFFAYESFPVFNALLVSNED
jgi:hypothetical protein